MIGATTALRPLPRRLGLIARVAVSAGILALLAAHADWDLIVTTLVGFDIGALIGVLFLLHVQLFVAARRWRHVDRSVVGASAGFPFLRVFLIAQAFAQVLPTGFGGDAVRIGLLVHHGRSVLNALASVLSDRIVGLMGTLTFLMLSSGLLWALGPDALPPTLRGGLGYALIIASGACAAAMIGAFLRPPFRKPVVLVRGIEAGRNALRALARPTVAVTTVANIVLTVVCYQTILRGLGLSIPVLALIWCVQVVGIAQLAPIAFGGWGIREVSLVALLGEFGLGYEPALAVALIYGAAVTATAMPGLILLALDPKGARCPP